MLTINLWSGFCYEGSNPYHEVTTTMLHCKDANIPTVFASSCHIVHTIAHQYSHCQRAIFTVQNIPFGRKSFNRNVPCPHPVINSTDTEQTRGKRTGTAAQSSTKGTEMDPLTTFPVLPCTTWQKHFPTCNPRRCIQLPTPTIVIHPCMYPIAILDRMERVQHSKKLMWCLITYTNYLLPRNHGRQWSEARLWQHHVASYL